MTKKTLKQIAMYIFWIIMSLLIGIVYMRLLLGSPSKINYKGFDYLVGIYYYHGLVFVGTIVGIFIAFFFFMVDYFFLRKKLSNDFYSIVIRISVLFLISIIIGIIHYFLEKVIDII